MRVSQSPIVVGLFTAALSQGAGCPKPGVLVRLQDGQTVVSAQCEENGTASGQVKTRYLGGGDSLIITGFNPDYLLEIVESIPTEQLIVEVQQNKPTARKDQVAHCPAVFCGWSERQIVWALMPVSTGTAEGRESLGSNYREEAA
jgi:DNA polymerase III sliding clamp (beta) subunit (PCNA family)